MMFLWILGCQRSFFRALLLVSGRVNTKHLYHSSQLRFNVIFIEENKIQQTYLHLYKNQRLIRYRFQNVFIFDYPIGCFVPRKFLGFPISKPPMVGAILTLPETTSKFAPHKNPPKGREAGSSLPSLHLRCKLAASLREGMFYVWIITSFAWYWYIMMYQHAVNLSICLLPPLSQNLGLPALPHSQLVRSRLKLPTLPTTTPPNITWVVVKRCTQHTPSDHLNHDFNLTVKNPCHVMLHICVNHKTRSDLAGCHSPHDLRSSGYKTGRFV